MSFLLTKNIHSSGLNRHLLLLLKEEKKKSKVILDLLFSYNAHTLINKWQDTITTTNNKNKNLYVIRLYFCTKKKKNEIINL